MKARGRDNTAGGREGETGGGCCLTLGRSLAASDRSPSRKVLAGALAQGRFLARWAMVCVPAGTLVGRGVASIAILVPSTA